MGTWSPSHWKHRPLRPCTVGVAIGSADPLPSEGATAKADSTRHSFLQAGVLLASLVAGETLRPMTSPGSHTVATLRRPWMRTEGSTDSAPARAQPALSCPDVHTPAPHSCSLGFSETPWASLRPPLLSVPPTADSRILTTTPAGLFLPSTPRGGLALPGEGRACQGPCSEAKAREGAATECGGTTDYPRDSLTHRSTGST